MVTFELADLADVLLRRHGLEVVHEAGVDVRVEVDVLGLVRGALRRVVFGNLCGKSTSELGYPEDYCGDAVPETMSVRGSVRWRGAPEI